MRQIRIENQGRLSTQIRDIRPGQLFQIPGIVEAYQRCHDLKSDVCIAHGMVDLRKHTFNRDRLVYPITRNNLEPDSWRVNKPKGWTSVQLHTLSVDDYYYKDRTGSPSQEVWVRGGQHDGTITVWSHVYSKSQEHDFGLLVVPLKLDRIEDGVEIFIETKE